MTGADTGESETDRDDVDREKQGAHSRHKVKRISKETRNKYYVGILYTFTPQLVSQINKSPIHS